MAVSKGRSIMLGAAALAWVTRAGAAERAPEPPPAPRPIIGGDIRRVVTDGDRLAVIDGDAVVLLSGRGDVLGRRPPVAAEAGVAAARRRGAGGLSADEVLDLQGVPDDDLEGDLVQEALDLEGMRAPGGGRRRRARRLVVDAGGAREPGGGASALAAARGTIWAAAGGRLWRSARGRGDAGAAARASAPSARWSAGPASSRRAGISAIAAAESAPVVVALAGDTLIRSGDGGASWTPVSVLASRARAIELSRDGGDVYILDDDGVGQVAGRARTPIFAGRAYAAVRCGDDLLILADDGVYAWRWETGVEKRSDRLPARRLACSAEVPGLVLAVGAALLVSRDGGRRWRARDDLDLPAINDAAATADAVWIATAAGLYTLPLDAAAARGGGAGDRANREAGRSLPPALDDARVRGGAGFWRALLPRVSFVLAMVDSQPGTSRTAVWLLLTFPLDRSPVGPAQRAAALERDRLRRRAAVAAELARLRGGAAGAGPRPNDDNGDNDNDSDDERAATQRALRASWEGLR